MIRKTLAVGIIFLFIGAGIIPSSLTQIVNYSPKSLGIFYEGQILFAPIHSTNTYLINNDGVLNHIWSSDYNPGYSVYMLDDGSIFRTIKLKYSGSGAGGGVQKITWDDELIWDFRYDTNSYLSHHDIEILPNGNILMIAWEYKTRNEAIAAGRDPNKLIGLNLWPDHVIEVEPTGPSSGEIVWEWHVWDHLIQDYDSSRDNYGVVGDHPELMDINFGYNNADWLHTNSIDYNEEFDQILLSFRNTDEIWIIDHSTTIEEAAGHVGGNSGKGGDILYRWGNPRVYHAGTSSDQKFFKQHDARWIKPGCPGEGNILVFNNGGGRPGTDYTSVDEIVPPVDEEGNYYLEPGSAYGPEEQIWIYDTNFFAWYIGGAQRLPNGNTLVCNGPAGELTEVTPEKVIVWEYENPYPNPLQNNVFKFQYYPPDEKPPFANFIFSPVIPKKNETVHFNDISTDNGTIINWFWDFGDGNTSTVKNPTHRYTEVGSFIVTLNVTDNDGLTDEISKNINVLLNNPPSSPTIDGPTNGKAGTSYYYDFTTTDPDGEDVKYYIDWGDGTIDPWDGPYESNEVISKDHIWSEQGDYIEWGTLEVTMPVNHHYYSFPLLQRLLERFPNAFPILRCLQELHNKTN